MRDLCAPIGPSIARGRGPDYARAAVGRVPQVRVQSLHYYLNAVSGPSGRASALPLHNPNLHTVMSLCAGLSVCFSDRATRIFSGSRMSPRGLKTAKIKGLGASAVLRAPLRNPGVLTLLLASLRDSTARSDCARGRLEEAREEPASAPLEHLECSAQGETSRPAAPSCESSVAPWLLGRGGGARFRGEAWYPVDA